MTDDDILKLSDVSEALHPPRKAGLDAMLLHFGRAVRNATLEECAKEAMDAEPQSGLAGHFRSLKVAP